MAFVYAGMVVGVIGIVILSVIAVRLFKTVRVFGKEVARVSDKLNEAAAELAKAAESSPNGPPRPKPEP